MTDNLIQVEEQCKKHDENIIIGSLHIDNCYAVDIKKLRGLKSKVDFFYKGNLVFVGNIAQDDFTDITGISFTDIEKIYPDGELKLEVIYSKGAQGNNVVYSIELVLYMDDDEKFNVCFTFLTDVWNLIGKN